MADGARPNVGQWVTIDATAPLSGVVLGTEEGGLVVVQIVVGEWMVSSSDGRAGEVSVEAAGDHLGDA